MNLSRQECLTKYLHNTRVPQTKSIHLVLTAKTGSSLQICLFWAYLGAPDQTPETGALQALQHLHVQHIAAQHAVGTLPRRISSGAGGEHDIVHG